MSEPVSITEDPPPSWPMILWAGLHAGIRLPADRPWFHAPPPPPGATTWPYRCRCGFAVEMAAHPCDGGGAVFVGQCAGCQTVLWSYRGA